MKVEEKKELSIELSDEEIEKLNQAQEVLATLILEMEKNKGIDVDFGHPHCPEYYTYEKIQETRATLINLKSVHTMNLS